MTVPASDESFDALIARLAGGEPGTVEVVDVPRLRALVVSGTGFPGAEQFRTGVQDLWKVARAVHELPDHGWKVKHHVDYVMPPTEVAFATDDRAGAWDLLVPQPDFVDDEVLEHAYADLFDRGVEVVGEVVLADRAAQRAVQSMHVGHPKDQGATVALVTAYAAEHGLALGPGQHEILIDDPVVVGFDKARALIRYAVRT